MKKIFWLLLILYFLTGCKKQNPSHTDIVSKYYSAFNSSDYYQIKSLITDSLTIISGDYIMPFSQESYYEQFKWDSVFQPTYKIIDIENQNDQVIATISSSSLRYEFLKNNPLSFRYKITLSEGKISKLEELDYAGTDWNIWQQERDALVKWITNNHPELDGFIYDMTKQGAINYLKAIELYNNRTQGPGKEDLEP